MSRKSRAMEQKFRGKDLKPWEKEKPPSWKEAEVIRMEKYRNCTLADISKFIEDRKEAQIKGYWMISYYGANYHFDKNWEAQVNKLYREVTSHTRIWTWTEIEEEMVRLWKSKYTKLGRILS